MRADRTPPRVAYDPLRPPDRDDPHGAFARMHRDGTRVGWSAALDAVVVSGYDAVVTLASDHVRLSSAAATATPRVAAPVHDVLAAAPAYALRRPMVSTDPPLHTRLRRPIAAALAQRMPELPRASAFTLADSPTASRPAPTTTSWPGTARRCRSR